MERCEERRGHRRCALAEGHTTKHDYPRRSHPLFYATVDWSGRSNGLGWFTSKLWVGDERNPRPQLLIKRDLVRGGWYATRWSRRKEDWVPVPGSRRSTRHDAAVAAYVAIRPDDPLRTVSRRFRGKWVNVASGEITDGGQNR